MILVSEFDKYQDVHSSAWFMFISTSRAFGLWLDLICCVFIGIVTLSFVVFGEGIVIVYINIFITFTCATSARIILRCMKIKFFRVGEA